MPDLQYTRVTVDTSRSMVRGHTFLTLEFSRHLPGRFVIVSTYCHLAQHPII